MENVLRQDELSDLNQYDSWSFGDSTQLADQLLELVLAGRKTATSGPLETYKGENADLPKVGHRSVVLDFVGTPKCLIETTESKIVPFNQVDDRFAADEGDLSLEYWRKAHAEFSRRHVDFREDMLFVCERFKLIRRLDE